MCGGSGVGVYNLERLNDSTREWVKVENRRIGAVSEFSALILTMFSSEDPSMYITTWIENGHAKHHLRNNAGVTYRAVRESDEIPKYPASEVE